MSARAPVPLVAPPLTPPPPSVAQAENVPPREAAQPPVAVTPTPSVPAVTGEIPPWRRYAIAEPPYDGRPQIAIVIDDMGIDRTRSARAIGLPAAVTLAFLPYSADVVTQTGRARAAGHELLVHMPMQPDDTKHNDPGPNALLLDLDKSELERRVRWNLERFGGYVGVNNHMGSRFTAQVVGMEIVLDEVKSRGLLFLDSRTSAGSVGAKLARQLGIPGASRDIFLDNDDRAPQVSRQLGLLEQVARRQGYGIAIGHPHDGTLDALEHWLPSLTQKGFSLVPLTAIVRRQTKG